MVALSHFLCCWCPPQANASALVGNRLSLLLDDDLEEVTAAADRLKGLLPNITVDKFVEYYPQVLDIDDFELALQVQPGELGCQDPSHLLYPRVGQSLVARPSVQHVPGIKRACVAWCDAYGPCCVRSTIDGCQPRRQHRP